MRRPSNTQLEEIVGSILMRYDNLYVRDVYSTTDRILGMFNHIVLGETTENIVSGRIRFDTWSFGLTGYSTKPPEWDDFGNIVNYLSPEQQNRYYHVERAVSAVVTAAMAINPNIAGYSEETNPCQKLYDWMRETITDVTIATNRNNSSTVAAIKGLNSFYCDYKAPFEFRDSVFRKYDITAKSYGKLCEYFGRRNLTCPMSVPGFLRLADHNV